MTLGPNQDRVCPWACPWAKPEQETEKGIQDEAQLLHFVTKRRNSWACIGNPNPGQEAIEGTHAQETSAYQRRPTTQHAAQGSNLPIRGMTLF